MELIYILIDKLRIDLKMKKKMVRFYTENMES